MTFSESSTTTIAARLVLLDVQTMPATTDLPPAPPDWKHRGAMLPPEKAYVDCLVALFEAGNVPPGLYPSVDGSTVRAFVAKELRCKVKRISNNFRGDKSLGTKIYERRGECTPGDADELRRLREAFQQSVGRSWPPAPRGDAGPKRRAGSKGNLGKRAWNKMEPLRTLAADPGVVLIEADTARLEAELVRLQARKAANPELCEAVERARKEAESAALAHFPGKKKSRGAAAPPRAKKPRLDDWIPTVFETVVAEDSAAWNDELPGQLMKRGFPFVERVAEINLANIYDVRLMTGVKKNDAVAVGVAALWRDRGAAFLDQARKHEGQIQPSRLPDGLGIDQPLASRTESYLHPIADLWAAGAGDSMGVRDDDDRPDLRVMIEPELTQISVAEKKGKRGRPMYAAAFRVLDKVDAFKEQMRKQLEAAPRAPGGASGLGS